jgi:hypothetical protein
MILNYYYIRLKQILCFFPTYSNFKSHYFILCLYTDIEQHKNILHKYKKQNRSHHSRTGLQKQTTVIRDAQRLRQEDGKPSCICKKGKPSARMRENREENDKPEKSFDSARQCRRDRPPLTFASERGSSCTCERGGKRISKNAKKKREKQT